MSIESAPFETNNTAADISPDECLRIHTKTIEGISDYAKNHDALFCGSGTKGVVWCAGRMCNAYVEIAFKPGTDTPERVVWSEFDMYRKGGCRRPDL